MKKNKSDTIMFNSWCQKTKTHFSVQ
jgi:hypothetical protein